MIFNASFLTGIVPDRFKLARVIPVFKKGSQVSLSNYRPISLLSIFNKLLEKLVFNRLSNYLEKKELIYSKQFGFRSHHSTVQYLVLLIKCKRQSKTASIPVEYSWTSVKHLIL